MMAVVLWACALIAAPAQAEHAPPNEALFITAGVPRGFAPHYIVDEDGTVRGFAIDVMEELAHRANLHVQYRVYDNWAAVTEALKSGEIDVIPNMGLSEDREALGVFSPPYETLPISLFARANDPTIFDLNSLADKTVGTVSTNLSAVILGKQPDVTIHTFTSVQAMIKGLLSGQVDAIAYPEAVLWYEAGKLGVEHRIAHIGIPIRLVKRGLLYSPQNAALDERIRPYLQDLARSPEFDHLHHKWFERAPRAQPEEWLWLGGVVTLALIAISLSMAWGWWRDVRTTHDMPEQSTLENRLWRRVMLTALTIATGLVVVTLLVTLYLYEIATRQEQGFIAERAKSKMELMSAVATGLDESRDDVLMRLLQGFERSDSTSEVLLAERQGDEFVFRLRQKAAQPYAPRRLAVGGPLAEPMQRALHGETGTMIGTDYRGETVMAAYRPVPALGIGMVIKRDLAEIRAPYLKAGWTVSMFAVAVCLMGGLAYFRLTAPIIGFVLNRDAQFRRLFGGMVSGVLVCVRDEGRETFTVVDVNPAAARIENTPAEDLIGAKVRDIVPNMRESGVYDRLLQVWQDDGRQDFGPTAHPHADGTKWRMWSIYKIKGGECVLEYQDVTDLMVATEALRQSEERLDLAMRGSNDGLWDWDLITNRVFFSPRWKEMLGYDDDEIANDFQEWERRVHPDDIEDAKSILEQFFAQTIPSPVVELEFRMRHRDGHWINILARAYGVFDDDGRCLRMIGTHTDITQLKETERALRHEKEQFEHYLRISGNMLVVLEEDGTVDLVNGATCKVLGYSEEELVGENWFELCIPKAHVQDLKIVHDAVLDGTPLVEFHENEVLCKTGERRLIRWHNVAIEQSADGIARTLSSGEDITDQKAAERALRRETEARAELAEIVSQSPAVAFTWENTERWPVTYVSANIDQFGYRQDDFLNGDLTYTDIVHPDDLADLAETVESNIRRGVRHMDLTYRILTADGEPRWVETRVYDVHGDGRQGRGLVLDVTDRITAETRSRQYLKTAGSMFLALGKGARVRMVNDKTCEVVGLPEDEIVGRDWIATFLPPEVRDEARYYFNKVMDGEIQAEGEFENEIVIADGTRRTIHWYHSMLHNTDGTLGDNIAFGVDVTEQRAAEKRVREYALFPHENPNPVLRIDRTGDVLLANEAAQVFLNTIAELEDGQAYEAAADHWRALMDHALQAQECEQHELPFLQQTYVFEIVPGDHNAHVNLYGVDVTALKAAERKLQMAEKMEAVGHLTGGVAHDFNNLLTVILGNLQLLERQLRDDEKGQKRIEKIMRAAQSGAELTRRLLSFSRQQMLQTETVDINVLVQGMESLLRRTMGETIRIKTALAAEDCVGVTDVNRLENALLNLAINARDAMPDGGVLTIATAHRTLGADYAAKHSDVTPGPYIEISVSDTGEGMDRNTIKSIFDPFFTTKEPGKGTGLGLSTIYGFMKQTGGHISVYSEPERGTVFRLFVPMATDGADVRPIVAAHEPHSAAPVAAKILVVEDDPEVRAIATSMLRDAGHDIVEAVNGEDGLRKFKATPGIDLVFSDIVMPGSLDGIAMGRAIHDHDPAVPILFASGYAEQSLRNHAGEGVENLIEKPFTQVDLIARVDQLLRIRAND